MEHVAGSAKIYWANLITLLPMISLSLFFTFFFIERSSNGDLETRLQYQHVLLHYLETLLPGYQIIFPSTRTFSSLYSSFPRALC